MGINSAALHGSSQRASNDAFGFCDASGVTKTSSSVASACGSGGRRPESYRLINRIWRRLFSDWSGATADVYRINTDRRSSLCGIPREAMALLVCREGRAWGD